MVYGSTFRMLFDLLLDMSETIMGFMNYSIGDICWDLMMGVIPSMFPSLENITVLQAMFGVGLPTVLAYTLIIWALNSIT